MEAPLVHMNTLPFRFIPTREIAKLPGMINFSFPELQNSFPSGCTNLHPAKPWCEPPLLYIPLALAVPLTAMRLLLAARSGQVLGWAQQVSSTQRLHGSAPETSQENPSPRGCLYVPTIHGAVV